MARDQANESACLKARAHLLQRSNEEGETKPPLLFVFFFSNFFFFFAMHASVNAMIEAWEVIAFFIVPIDISYR